jgi:thiol:disulfide interchange protein DsbD
MMFLFGISMLGFGNLSKLQVLGNKLGTAKNPSTANAFWMGTGAGLVAAPCTGPVLASLLGWITASGDFLTGSILMVGYSFGFAVPYVFLGSASGKLSGFKVASFWQVAIKLVFGSVMMGLGFYYLRVPFYKLLPALENSWSMLATVGLVGGFGLLATILAKASLQNKKSLALLTAFLIGFGGFSLVQANYVAKKKKAEIVWIKDVDAAFAKAAESGKPILVDGWAEWCSSCKKMDVTTFADAQVAEKLKTEWVLLKLDLTESNDQNDALMQKFGIQSLPTLVMVPAAGDLERKKRILGYTPTQDLLQHLEYFDRHP